MDVYQQPHVQYTSAWECDCPKVSTSAPTPLKFDRWPWKTIGHLFYTTSSFVHHFIVIGEFKLELQSRNRNWDMNSVTMTLKFDGGPRKIIGHLFYTTSSIVHHFKSIVEFRLGLLSGNTQLRSIFLYDLEISWMILRKNWAPPLCYPKLWALFQSNQWIQIKLGSRHA